MKKIVVVFLYLNFLLLSSILASEPQASNSLEKIKLQLQWKYQFQFAGFIMAKEMGYYDEVGLDVEILEYDSGNIIEDILSDRVDFGRTNNTLSFKDRKVQDVSLIGTYFQRSPLVFITQPEVQNVLELKGKKIMATDNDFGNSSFRSIW